MIEKLTFRWLLLILMVIPWMNGGVDELPHMGFAVATTILAMGLSVVIFREQDRRLPIGLIPLVLGILLIGSQLIPINRMDSPLVPSAAFELRKELYSYIWPADQLPDQLFPHSLNPAGTRLQLADFCMAVVFFLAGAYIANKRKAFRQLCILMLFNGAAISIVSIVHRFSNSKELLWWLEVERSTIFGPFVYHNLAGSYFIFALGCGCALMVRDLHDSYEQQDHKGTSISDMIDGARRFVGELNVWRLTLITLTAFVSAALLFSLSRGAVISAVFGMLGLFGCLVLTFSKQKIFLSGTVIATCVIAVMFSYRMLDPVTERFTGLLEQETYEKEGRLKHWNDALANIDRFKGAGAGFGSYVFLHRLADTHGNRAMWHHAHNQYIEALVEGGLVALVLLLAQIVIVGFTAFRLLSNRSSFKRIVATTVIFVLVSQSVHGWFDYCHYLPSTMMLTALFCGMAFMRREKSENTPPIKGVWMRYAVSVGLPIVSLLGCVEVIRTERVQFELSQFPWKEDIRNIQLKDFDQHVKEIEVAIEANRSYGFGLEALAKLYLKRYQLAVLKELSAEYNISESDANLWQWTSPLVLYDRASNFRLEKKHAELSDLKTQRTVTDNFMPAADYAVRQVIDCPLLVGGYLVLETVVPVIDWDYPYPAALEAAALLEPSHPEILFEIGDLYFASQRFDQAFDMWKRSLMTSQRPIYSIILRAEQQISTKEICERILPKSPEILIKLAKTVYASEERDDDREVLLDRAMQSLPEVLQTAEDHFFLAEVLSIKPSREVEKSIEHYEAGLRLNPTLIERRYECASLYHEIGDRSNALKHARLCARSKPNNRKYRRLLSDIRKDEKRF